MSPELKNLLNAIGSKEAPKGYDQIYTRAERYVGQPAVSKMTLDQVLALQDRMRKSGSTAAGRYQFLQSTLRDTIKAMGLKGSWVWSPALQDEMAVHLMERRKLNNYLMGIISAEDFANNLAMEWASLPVVTTVKGAHRVVRPGESYYAGDGLNKALHAPATILALVKALKAPQESIPPPPDIPAIEPGPQKPRGLLKALLDLIWAIFKKG